MRCGERQFADFDDGWYSTIAGIAKIHAERLRRSAVFSGWDIRQIGTIAALELRTDDAGHLSAMRPAVSVFLERGVLLRPLAMSYVPPPYVIAPTSYIALTT